MSKENLPVAEDKENSSSPRSLQSAIEKAKTRLAENGDVGSQSHNTELTYLRSLADELHPIMQEIDETDSRFDFGMSHGGKPRLWIDMTSFVSMGLDNTTYRFLKDTRMGRIVLAETTDQSHLADIVSDYVAERIVERERMLEGDWESIKSTNEINPFKLDTEEATESSDLETVVETDEERGFWGSFGWFLFGMLCTLLVVAGTLILLSPDAL